MPLITRLEEHFTKYEAKQVAHLTSKYATRLYELLIAWREVERSSSRKCAFHEKHDSI